MAECFPDVQVTTSLTRPSYWFQSDEASVVSTPTIVLPLFLNAFHWVDTMRKHPKYMPNHMDLDWEMFISKPWTTDRSENDETFLAANADNANDNICQLGFKYNEINSCVEELKTLRSEAPIYELRQDGSGKPFDSILELREEKIRNWMMTADYENVEFVIPVQYETLVEEGGLASIANAVERRTKLKSHCGYISQEGMETSDASRAPVFWEELDPEYVKSVRTSINWKVESKIGYDEDVPIVSAPEASNISPPG